MGKGEEGCPAPGRTGEIVRIKLASQRMVLSKTLWSSNELTVNINTDVLVPRLFPSAPCCQDMGLL